METDTSFTQGVDSAVAIVGTSSTTPYGSLQEALGAIQIQTSIPALHQLLITQAGEFDIRKAHFATSLSHA